MLQHPPSYKIIFGSDRTRYSKTQLLALREIEGDTFLKNGLDRGEQWSNSIAEHIVSSFHHKWNPLKTILREWSEYSIKNAVSNLSQWSWE